MSNLKIKLNLSLVIVFFLFCSCKKDMKYDVDSELDPYLQRFLYEANARGRNFNLEKKGLVMEFADLESPVIGRCYRTLPIRVHIDKSYWAATLNSANMENLREDVVFHELAHGLLSRDHVNSTLDNTEW